MTTSTKVNSFTILKTKNQFILLCWKKKLWRMCTNFWINPHNGKLPSRLAPAQCQNSLTPQLLSNIYWSKTKTSISLNRVYWYDTMCHIFSCYIWFSYTSYIVCISMVKCWSWSIYDDLGSTVCILTTNFNSRKYKPISLSCYVTYIT